MRQQHPNSSLSAIAALKVLPLRNCFRRFLICATDFFCILVLCIAGVAFGQESKDKDRLQNKEVQRRSRAARDLSDWKILLDNLAVETRTLEPEEERPFVIAEVADAYWRFDKDHARKLFGEAFDAALTLKTSQQSHDPVAAILSKVAKRDRALAMELAKRLRLHHAKEKPSAARSLKAARDLLESDPAFAVELVKDSASTGPSMSGLWLVFRIAETDPARATEIYDVYLKSVANSPDLSSVLWLAGYPLGYGEAYGGSMDPASLTGFGGLRVPGLQAQPALAGAYFQVAFAAVTNTLTRAAQASSEERERLNALALFSASYLYPEVRRYLPSAEGAWSALYRQASIGTSEIRRADVERRLQSMLEVRARVSQYQSNEEYARGDVKEKLDLIEKLPDGCSRDRSYAELALATSYSKDFTQARQLADRIDNLGLRESVLQYTYYDEANASIESDLVRASDIVEKVSAKDQRAMLYVKIARAALKKSDKSMVIELLNRARVLVRGSDDPAFQAGVLLSAGGIYAQFDTLEATYVMKESIKAINRMKERVADAFSVVRRVNLNCSSGEGQWYGDRERSETFNLYETLATIARSDVQGEGALSIASEIEDKPTRIRAQLAVVRAVTK